MIESFQKKTGSYLHLEYMIRKKKLNSALLLNEGEKMVQLLRACATLAKDWSCISEDLIPSSGLHKQLHASSQTHTYTHNSHN